MPRKQYLQHLTEVLHASPDKSVDNIRRGEDDGSFILSYKPPGIESLIEITGLIPDLSDYPTQHQTYLYTSSPDVPAYITDALNSIEAHGLSLSPLIQSIATSLNKVVIQKSKRSEGKTVYSDYEDLLEDDDDDILEEDDDDEVGGWSDDEAARLEEADQDEDAQMNDALNDSNRPENLPELRRDLREAKRAGFRVGVLGDIKGGIDCYISLSVRTSKLGLSDEAMNAWKLDKDRYLILLIHYNHYYKTLAELLRHIYHGKQSVQFCVGTSTHYKPTMAEAIGAFSTVLPMQSETVYEETIKEPKKGFAGIFISRPLNELLNSRLVDLVSQRVRYELPWHGAERYWAEWQGRAPQNNPDLETYRTPEDTPANLPTIITLDALSNAEYSTSASFPLIAMQFVLRHLVRCTEFCLVCHNKINSNFEALKPYVCSNPLCLYQYMALGFGPSIEYEIISQPTVVDLLISFCYASAKCGNLTEFPNGMNLLVPPQETIQNLPDPLEFHAALDRTKTQHTLQCTYDMKPPVKRGEWIRVRNPQAVETFYYKVEDTTYFPKILLSAPVLRPIITAPVAQTTTQPQAPTTSSNPPVPAESTCEQVKCAVFSVNFDSMDNQAKQKVIAEMIDIIPPVYDMKSWLEENTSVGTLASLKNWTEKISPAACGILRWIIASNRSCIISVDEVDKKGNKSENTKEPRIWGMHDYHQFRFAMGAPDKEQRFVKAVKEAQQKNATPYPTLFAFHGSPLQNWHAIIREGLHFKKTVNGRAYGHGCYHSLSLSTSLYYCSNNQMNNWNIAWPNSVLNVGSAICLNEIVNSPNEFVSTTPHLVISQLDWIQTRYLFVTTRGTASRTGSSVVTTTTTTTKESKRKSSIPMPSAIINQDPTMSPQNVNNEKLIIPLTGSSHLYWKTTEIQPSPAPVSTSSGIFASLRKSKMSKVLGSKLNPINLDEDSDSDASVATEEGDQLILLSDDEESGKRNVAASSGNKLLSKAANLLGIGPNKKKENIPLTDFVPGSLDMTNIELIPPPTYASSVATRRLQAELKAVLRVQDSTPLHELGWYINPDIVNNVYQWVFEFHSFDEKLPLAQDMKLKGIKSIVMEARFGSNFPMSPPFVRVIRPRFLGFQQGGGGHVTLGGALCMELLTNNGWSAVSSVESVLLQVRMAMTSTEPRPARLAPGAVQSYTVGEAKEAYIRACRLHNWQVPADFSTF